jgi:hypothetical protein
MKFDYTENGLTNEEVAERISPGQINAQKFITRSTSGILKNNLLSVFNGIIGISIIEGWNKRYLKQK